LFWHAAASSNGFDDKGAPLLASATGSGLCRIDWLIGSWNKNRIPYGGIEGIRMEADVDHAEDDETMIEG
jgi:transcription factor C subunit 6